MNSIKDTILNIVSSLNGVADIHDIINADALAHSRIVDVEDAVGELVEEDKLAKDELGMYQLMG